MISSRQLGERIAHARKRRGLTQVELAASVGLGRTTLISLEKGQRRPSDAELVGIARVLEVPLHDLLKAEWVRPTVAPRFRVAPRAGVKKKILEKAVERLEDLAVRYVELERIHGLERMPGPLETIQTYRRPGSGAHVGLLDPGRAGEHTARAARDLLDLGDAPAGDLVELLDADLRVFCIELPSPIAAIFLWGEEIGGCVALNRAHSGERRRWSLAHELGHFLRDRESGEILPTAGPPRRGPSELFADAFAAELLLPSSGVRRKFTDLTRAQGGRFTVGDVLRMAKVYGASFQAMMFRLEELRLLPPGARDLMTEGRFEVRDGAMELGLAWGESKTPPVFPRRYLLLALGAFRRERISETELARYLECDRLGVREMVRELMSALEGEGDLALDVSRDLLEAPEG